MTGTISVLGPALRCAQRGWAVLPLNWVAEDGTCSCNSAECSSIGKHPRTRRGVKDASKSQDTIRAWWEKWPDANLGLATGKISGIVVLDVDRRHGGIDSLRKIENKYGSVPDGPRVLTGGGGTHLYFRYPGRDIRNRIGIFPGIDVRGDGAFVVAPASVHASGEQYLWEHGKSPKLPLPEMPDWLLDMITGGQQQPSSADGEAIPEGRRNAKLASLAGAMRFRGMSIEAIEAGLLVENEARCRPPLPDDEVERIAASIGNYAPGTSYTEDGSTAPAEGTLNFQTPAEIKVASREQVPWIAKPWLAAGSITELDGKVKHGKTTWILDMGRSAIDGVEFMGQPTTQTSVVYLTEQPRASFREALARADLLDSQDMRVLFWSDTLGFSWPVVVEAAVQECKKQGAKILIIDTVAQFARLTGENENSSGDALAVMQPLQMAAAEGLGVLMARHERKAGGDVGDSGRGSSAFAGAVDIVLSLRRPPGKVRSTVRQLQALSRFGETPTEVMIELGPDGFVALGDAADVALREAVDAVLAATQEQAMTMNQLVAATNLKRSTLQRAIKNLISDHRLVQVGRGKRGDPICYQVAVATADQEPTASKQSKKRSQRKKRRGSSSPRGRFQKVRRGSADV